MFAAMLDVLTKTSDASRRRAPDEVRSPAPARRWSLRRTWAFIFVVCSLMWAAIILGLYGILSLLPHG